MGSGSARAVWRGRLLPSDLTWLDEMACSDADPELFTSEGGGVWVRQALAYCDGCVVRAACRDFMLETRPLGPRGVVAGGWVFRANGRQIPHPADVARWRQLVGAAALRLGEPVPKVAKAA